MCAKIGIKMGIWVSSLTGLASFATFAEKKKANRAPTKEYRSSSDRGKGIKTPSNEEKVLRNKSP